MSQGASDSDIAANYAVGEFFSIEYFRPLNILPEIPDITGRPSGKIIRKTRKPKNTEDDLPHKANNETFQKEFWRIVDYRRPDGSFEGWFWDLIFLSI